MRVLCVLISALFLLTPKIFADEYVSGIVTVSKDKVFKLINLADHKVYNIIYDTYDVAEHLSKLHTFDQIQGIGFITPLHEILISSIDFVGLNDLLGEWQNNDVKFKFKNFTDGSYYTSVISGHFNLKNDYRYAVTPGLGSEWKVFFTDKNQVNISSLEITDKNKATIIFYDNNTGDIKKRLNLRKIHKN